MQAVVKGSGRIKLTGLKRFALEHLTSGPLRDDILSQPDEIDPTEFLASARIWLRLAHLDSNRRIHSISANPDRDWKQDV